MTEAGVIPKGRNTYTFRERRLLKLSRKMICTSSSMPSPAICFDSQTLMMLGGREGYMPDWPYGRGEATW